VRKESNDHQVHLSTIKNTSSLFHRLDEGFIFLLFAQPIQVGPTMKFHGLELLGKLSLNRMGKKAARGNERLQETRPNKIPDLIFFKENVSEQKGNQSHWLCADGLNTSQQD